MYLERHEFKKAYARIRDASIIGGCTVLILAAPDCDAICAARILTHLLRSDSIEYKLVAVAGFTDVQKEIQAAAAVTAGGVSPLRSVILLNCGAGSKLKALVDPSATLPASGCIYVIDANRPFNHNNLRDTESVVVLGWGTVDASAIPKAGDSDCEDASDYYEYSDDEDDEEDGDGDDAASDGGSDAGSAGAGGGRATGKRSSSSKKHKRKEEKKSSRRRKDKSKGSKPRTMKRKATAAAAGAASGGAGDDDDDGAANGAGAAASSSGVSGVKRKRSAAAGADGHDAGAANADDGDAGAASASAASSAALGEEGVGAGGGGASSSARGSPARGRGTAAKRRRRNDSAAVDGVGDDDDEDGGGSDGDDEKEEGGDDANDDVDDDDASGDDEKEPDTDTDGEDIGSDDSDEDDDDDDDGDDASTGSFISSSDEEVDEAAAARKAAWRGVIKKYKAYYSGHGYGHPAAFLCYEIAEQLGRGRNDMLWLAIVGVTDHYLLEHISTELYAEMYAHLRSIVLTRNDVEKTREVDDDGDDASASGGRIEKSLSAGKGGFIAESVEPRFVSHRFWNIYDSMSCSEYIATRLDTYKDDASGRSKLDRLLALSGVHLRTAKEPWTSMPQADKKLLWDALHAICEERLGDPFDFPIRPEMWYPSFTRAVDRETEVSAADVCNAINGLLAAGRAAPALLEHVKGTLGTESLAVAAGAAGAASSAAGGAASAAAAAAALSAPGSGAIVLAGWLQHTWREAWLEAYECVSKRGTSDLFLRGIKCYAQIRKAILRLGNGLMRAGRVANGRMTIQITVDDDAMTDSDKRVFTQPIALHMLARYMIKLYRDATDLWRSKRTGELLKSIVRKPVVISVMHPYTATGSQWVTISGLPMTEDIEHVATTNFLEGFQDAAKRAGAQYLMDSFDAATLLMDNEHKTRFLQLLNATD